MLPSHFRPFVDVRRIGFNRIQNFVKAYLFHCKRQSSGSIFSSRCDWVNKRRPRKTICVGTSSTPSHTNSRTVYLRYLPCAGAATIVARSLMNTDVADSKPVVAIFSTHLSSMSQRAVAPTHLATSVVVHREIGTAANTWAVHRPSDRFLRWWRQLPLAATLFRAIRLKYKGKSYKWARKRRALVLRFNFAHLVFLPIPLSIHYKKKKKMQLKFYGACKWELRAFCTTAIKWRPMNTYHGRGLRLAKQRVFRKNGKVSAYR